MSAHVPNTIPESLATHPFTQGLSKELLREMARGGAERTYETGDRIVREGDAAKDFFLLLSGKVAVEAVAPDRPHVTIQTLGGGEVLGWSWLMPPDRWRFDARALKPTKVWAVDTDVLLAAMEAHPADGYLFLRRLLPVIAERLEHTRLQLLDIYAP